MVIETDCLVVVQAIRSPLAMSSYSGDIIHACKLIMAELNNVIIVFVRPSANAVAHALARETHVVADHTFGGEDVTYDSCFTVKRFFKFMESQQYVGPNNQ